MYPSDGVRLSNPMRYLVPGGTGLLALAMFIPPLGIAEVSGTAAVLGSLFLTVCIAWLFRSAWIAPFELIANDEAIAVRRWSGVRRYELNRVRKWWFAIPNGAPTRVAPETNGVLYVVFDDRTRFRAEVTSEEAQRIAQTLDAVR